MNIIDKNQTLEAPDGEAEFATPIGSFLMLQYHDWDRGVKTNVYLNDQGREVLRTTEKAETRVEAEEQVRQRSAEVDADMAPYEPEPEPKPPVGRRFRFAAGFWLMLEGIVEMSKCLRR